MQIRGEYDLIIVGDQLVGFLLAAGAAQAGFKVLVIEGASLPTALHERPSGRFLTDTACEPLLGLAPGSKEDEFLRSLGLYQEMQELFPQFSPPLQVLTPNWRVDYTYVASELERELTREIGHNATPLVRVLSGQAVSKKSFVGAIAHEKIPVVWERFGALQLALYSSAAPSEIPYSAYKKVVDLAAHGGVRYSIGGRSALKERLLSRMQVHHGDIKRNAWVREIVFERGRLAGVLLSTYEGFVRSPIVVGSMAAKTFLSLVPKEVRPKHLTGSVAAIEAKYWRMSFSVTLPEEMIPEGLGEHFTFFDPEQELEEDNFFQAQLLPKEVYGGIPDKHRVLVTRFLVPYVEKSLKPEFIQRLMRRVLLKLEKFIPGIRSQSLRISPNPDSLELDPVYQKHFHFPTLKHIPPSHLVYLHTLEENLLTHTFMDWSGFGLEGLALCSRDMDPLLGLMGEIRSAMDLLSALVAKRARQTAKKR